MLLSTHSIEPIYTESQTIHIKPLSNASQVTSDYGFLQPLLIQGERIYVKWPKTVLKKGKGWIRWRDGDQLLINYSLLN